MAMKGEASRKTHGHDMETAVIYIVVSRIFQDSGGRSHNDEYLGPGFSGKCTSTA